MSEMDRLDRALDKLAAGQSPRDDTGHLQAEELAMLRMAQLLSGAEVDGPRPEFKEQLRRRLFGGRVSRKVAIGSGLAGLAAGLAAALGFEGLQRPSRGSNLPSAALVGPHGKWFRVAAVSEVADGAIVPFTAGAVQGFLINRGGKYRALSRICTHMGCTLRFSRDEQAFECPCHGAEFDLRGSLRYGPGGYGHDLPPLPSIEVRIRAEHIEVKGA